MSKNNFPRVPPLASCTQSLSPPKHHLRSQDPARGLATEPYTFDANDDPSQNECVEESTAQCGAQNLSTELNLRIKMYWHLKCWYGYIESCWIFTNTLCGSGQVVRYSGSHLVNVWLGSGEWCAQLPANMSCAQMIRKASKGSLSM